MFESKNLKRAGVEMADSLQRANMFIANSSFLKKKKKRLVLIGNRHTVKNKKNHPKGYCSEAMQGFLGLLQR